jgi:hypothetical protein
VKVNGNVACLAAFIARFALAVPQDALVAAASHFAVTPESSELYIQMCVTFPAFPGVPDLILQLLRLNDRETGKAVLERLVPIAALQQGIVRIDEEGGDYDLILFATILGALPVKQLRLTRAENRLLCGLTGAEMNNCVEHWPFLVIPDLVLLWEFAPHDMCDEFIALLIASFHETKNRQFVWKVLDASSCGTVRPLLVDENKLELVAAFPQTPRFLLPNRVKVGVSDISLLQLSRVARFFVGRFGLSVALRMRARMGSDGSCFR